MRHSGYACLQGTEACEYPFLEEVYRPRGEHKIEYDVSRYRYAIVSVDIDFFCSLIFVHGLNSLGRNKHPYETWTHDNDIFGPPFSSRKTFLLLEYLSMSTIHA